MKTYFYNRTAYSLNLPNMTVPQCFIELDAYFDTLFKTPPAGLTNESVRLAENLCRRIADTELFAHYMHQAQSSPNVGEQAILIGTLLVAYFNACKSLLDAGSITLAKVYKLGLANKQMDFSKEKFWRELEEKAGTMVKKRYARFKSLFTEIVKWRDSAIHRLTPLVIVHSSGPPDKVEEREIKMVAQPDVDISMVLKRYDDIEWVEPLYYHKKWRSQLTELCQEVCLDIRSKTV